MVSTTDGTMDSLVYQPRLVDSLIDELLTQLSGLFVVGPRASGKTTTISRRATTIVRLDEPARAAAFEADPDVALRQLEEPILIDEWQLVPEVFGAVRRSIDLSPHPNRYFLTGSVLAEQNQDLHAGTGRVQRIEMFPMTEREVLGRFSRSTFFDQVFSGKELKVPSSSPDLEGYVDLALRGGFPMPALRLNGLARQSWLENYVQDLLTRDTQQLRQGSKAIDPRRLQRYFEAYALNSAGVVADKSLYEAAGVNKATAARYEDLLTDLLVVRSVPAWTSNRIKRLVLRPKRYVVDPALIAAQLRIDRAGVIADGNLLGRVIDTFVAAQLRPEVAVSRSRPRLHHLRTQDGRHEIDLVAELADGKLICIEIKAGSAPKRSDARHLEWFKEQMGDRVVGSFVFHTGPQIFELGDGIVAVPISTLWA